MAENIKIQLSDLYEPVTEDDIRKGKNFVLRRESASRGLASLVDALLADAAAKITQICYKYGVEPTSFQISYQYNEAMMEEIGKVMDELEEEILDLTMDYSARCTQDKEKKNALILWVLTLGKGNKALKASLEDRLRMFLKDVEAMVVAANVAKFDVTKAVTIIKSNLHTVYQMPGMQAAFGNASLYNAEYIRSRCVKAGYRGNSNSEANNIDRFVRMTVQMAWMHYHQQLYEEQGAAGYYVLRGSTYPCELCQSKVGFHDISDKDSFPPQHYHCVCFTVPVYERDINDLTV